MKPFLQMLFYGVVILFLIALWGIILLHPIYFVIEKDSVVWILLYIGIVPECIVGAVITRIAIAIVEMVE